MSRLIIPVLHGDGAYPEGFLHSSWSIEPTVAIGIIGLIAAYVAWTGPLNRRRPGAEERPVTVGQTVAFLAGCLALLVALGPPLDDWAGYYLLSAHMVQHLILMLLVAPLWLLGIPSWVLSPLTKRATLNRVGAFLTRPAVAFLLANAVFVLWHLPGLYNASLGSEPVHILQHQMFLAASVLAWWPILGPVPAWPRLTQPLQCLYLFLMTIPGGIIGAFITLAEPGLYDGYAAAPRLWGIGLAADQQMAGLMMWVFENVIYLILITIIFFQWAAQAEREERGQDASASPRPVGQHSPVARPEAGAS